jgi:uncharacterized protein (DUF486 family)
MRGIASVFLLIISNFFMTFAWYGHLQFRKWNIFQSAGLVSIILISWLIALFEYIFQVPGNRLGYENNGGPFSLFQLKIIQEVITLTVFTLCSIFIFKTDKFQVNYLISFILMILAVYFVFKK